ncbi:MAG: alpha/beta fold hydrolase [Dokdonella sp.]|uniref:alpha/beta fold hydrolase n=1 Tax=Dokdonella sp. TaxID=2291710 RepID=UPI003F7D4393
MISPRSRMISPRWLLLPGLDGSGRLYARFLEQLAGIDAIIVSYPDDLARDLDAYARHARVAIGGADRCIIVAESFSGPVALRLQRLDARVQAIVLVASFVRCPHPVLRVLPPFLIAAFARRFALRPLLRAFCVGADASDECVDALRDVVRMLPADVLSARLALLRSLDESTALRTMRAPVLHLRASRDRLVRAVLAGDAPPTRLREVAIEGPHFLLQARPEACHEAIEAWIGGVLEDGPPRV